MKYITILGYFIYSSIIGTAQLNGLKQFTINNGLPINNVYCAAQDEDGFMWFGTDFGIVKFDGNNFAHYYTKDGMVNKAVTSIIYAGGDSLIYMSYPDVLQSIHTNGKINTIVKKYPLFVGNMYIHGDNFLFTKLFIKGYYEYKNSNLNYIDIDSTTRSKGLMLNGIVTMPNNNIAYCTSNGLYIKAANKITQLLSGQRVMYGIYTHNNTIVVATNKGIYSISQQYGTTLLNNQLPTESNILHMAEDANNDIWLRDINKGIYKLTNTTLVETSKILGLENKIVNKFFKDKSGNLWLCTSSEGIILIPNLPIKNYTTSNGLVNNNILNLNYVSNKLFIGTENGVSIYNNNTFATLPLMDKGLVLNYVFNFPKLYTDTLAGCIRSSLLKDENLTNINDYIVTKNLGGYPTVFYNGFNAFVNKQKELLIASGQGRIVKINTTTKALQLYNLSNFGVRKIYTFFELNNDLWLGTDKGILIWKNYETFVLNDTIANQKLQQVFDFKLAADNTLWIATDVGMYTYSNNIFAALPKGETVGSNYCKKIIIVNTNTILVATWDGILKIKNGVIDNINTSLGLASKVVNDIIYNPSLHQYFAATDNGLSQIAESLFDTIIPLPKVFVNAFYIVNKQSVAFNNKDALTANNNNLSFYFATPFYQGISDVVYEYKLDNGIWLTTKNPKVAINSISSGKHIVYVRYRLSSFGQVSTIAVFEFSIKIPFYKKWWFIVAAVLGLQFLIIYLINKRNAKVAAKKISDLQKLNEQAALKQQAFTALLNPHFIFNSLNSIQHFINQQDRGNANRYLSDFASLIRRNFEAAQQQFVPLETEIENLRLYLQLEQMRFGSKVTYTINIAPNVDAEEWMLPTLILQPYIENALLHGIMPLTQQGIITIQFTLSTNQQNLIIAIADNGIGIANSKALQTNSKHISRGMQLVNERLQILSQITKAPIKLHIQDQHPLQPTQPGTVVTLTYPIQVYEAYIKVKPLKVN